MDKRIAMIEEPIYLTWSMFKAFMDAKGVLDTDVIGYFDFSEPREIEIVDTPDGKRRVNVWG